MFLLNLMQFHVKQSVIVVEEKVKKTNMYYIYMIDMVVFYYRIQLLFCLCLWCEL